MHADPALGKYGGEDGCRAVIQGPESVSELVFMSQIVEKGGGSAQGAERPSPLYIGAQP